jgi:hypothetical protein
VTAPEQPLSYDEQDPFELPEWLGRSEVTWRPETGLGRAHLVRGALTADGRPPLPCDLLAVDDAYPEPVADDTLRVRAHQVWQHGEVLVLADAGRVVLAVPGSRLQLEDAVDAVGRLARAVGAPPGSYAILVRVPGDASGSGRPG